MGPVYIVGKIEPNTLEATSFTIASQPWGKCGMREKLRISGIDIVGDVPWGTHFCQFYNTKEDIANILVPYFKAGLENNELCVWITAQPLEVEEAKEAMRIAVPEIDVYLEKGQMEILPYTHGYIKEDAFDPERVVNSWVEKINQVLARGYDGLRATGDTGWLKKGGWDDFVDYERKVDALIVKNHVIALCPYYVDMCSTSEVIDVVSNHQFALIKKNGKWEKIENTGRKRAEKEAIKAAKNWENTFDAVEDLIAIIDTEYRVVRANKAMAARLGMTPEECIGLTCYHAIHETSEPPSFCPHRQLLKNGVEHPSEVYEDCLGGYFVVSTSLLFDTEGKPIGSIYVARDIKERKKVEKKLKESQEKYCNILETANEGILIIDSEARITYANQKMAEMLGYSQGEMIGKFTWDFVDEESKAILKLNMKMRLQGINEVYELKLICMDGSPLWALINPKGFFNEDGDFTGSLGMLTDITKRKQEEHRMDRYNLILEGINQIFSNVVQAKTEEELGNSCMSVVLEITGSQFGFINVVGTDGLLHDVAKSELGWEQCVMYDKTGHRSLPSNFVVHGLYGSVIKYEKSFFTNDPPSHHESIGLPDGHPPLTSFLGVPLVQDGKIVGLIAVANREGGYSCEQQEDLETIAPAVMQVLQRKKAEEALRLSYLNNRSLIEASLDPLVTIRPDGKITDVNGATENVTGYSREELIGTDFSDYYTEPDKARTVYQQVFTDGEVRDYPLEIQHTDGHKTPVLYNASVYRSENGEVIGVFAAARDITERKKAEETVKRAYENLENLIKERTAELEKAYESLKESEEGLAEAQRMSHIGNWDWDLVTAEVYWSDELYHIFGRNPQEPGADYDELLNYVHPDDRDYVDKSINKGLEEKPKNGIDYRIIMANGEERTVHSKAEVIFNEKNIPVRVKGIVQDITDRKKTEEKIQILASAVESSNDAIVTLSLEGTITSWNKAAEQIYGYLAEEILGKDVSILEPDNTKGEIKQFSKKIKQGKTVQHYESSRLKKDGTIINISVALSPIFDVTGKLVAISAIVRDVTERIKAEEALRESEARLRQFYESDIIGVFYHNLDGLITDANDKFLEILGYTREDLQAGEINWNRMTSSEYCSLDERSIAELINKNLKEPQETEYIRKDGSRVPVILGVATFNQARSEGISFVLDITEKKEAEEALANIEIARKKEIHHRIKNNLQVISSLLDLQAEKFGNRELIMSSEVMEAFRESQDRVISMALIHEKLHKSEGLDTLNFSPYIEELAENLFQTYRLGNANISLNMDLEENIFFDMDAAVPLGIVINELVSNSLKHAFTGREEGEIQIKLRREEKEDPANHGEENKNKGCRSTSFILTVSDNGIGIPESLDLEKHPTLGIQLVSSLVDQLDGELELKRKTGTEFLIRFTVTEKNNQASASHHNN